jgi:hypothetical protein
MTNLGSEGMELSCSSQLTVSMNPKALYDTHCLCSMLSRCSISSNEGRNFRHS